VLERTPIDQPAISACPLSVGLVRGAGLLNTLKVEMVDFEDPTVTMRLASDSNKPLLSLSAELRSIWAHIVLPVKGTRPSCTPTADAAPCQVPRRVAASPRHARFAPALRLARPLAYRLRRSRTKQEDEHMANTDKTNILDRLAEGITQLTSSERWQEWLTMQSRFHSYSFNNALLILGEKGIWILAPMVYKSDAGDDAATGDEPTKVIRGFKPVPVFDVSQTDGAELPEVCIRLEGEDESGLYDRLRTVATSIGFTVENALELGGANGMCLHDEHRILVLETNSPLQQVKTLAHELGHAILHGQGDGRPDNRELIELEAESVAFVVCAASGINSDGYSFGYVATWSGGGDEALAAIKASAPRIQRAASQLINALHASELAEVA
jgi:hypothetical protein